MVSEKIKNVLKETRKALTFDSSIKWYEILIGILPLLGIFYLFHFLGNKDFFTLKSQVNFLLTISWTPLVFYLEFVLISYFESRKENGENKPYPYKEYIINTKDFIKKIPRHNFYSLRPSWFNFFSLGLVYILILYISYRILPDIYTSKDIGLFAISFLLILIQFIILFFLVDLLSLTKKIRNMQVTALGSVIFSYIWIILLRIISDNSLIDFRIKIMEFVPKIIGSINTTAWIGSFIAIYLILKNGGADIRIGAEETFPLKETVFGAIIYSALIAIFNILIYSAPNRNNFLISSAQMGFIFVNLAIFLVLGVFLWKFLYNTKRIIELGEKNDESKLIYKISGIIKGTSTYSYKKSTYQNYTYENTKNFFILATESKEILLFEPKINIFTSFIRKYLFIADKVEVYGYYTRIKNENSKEDIEIFIPLITKILIPSKLRSILS